MRYTTLGTVLLAIVATACADGRSTSSPDGVGSLDQAAEFDTQTLFPIVDLRSAQVIINSDGSPVDVEVHYFGDKTTLTGHQVAAPVLAETFSFDALETGVHTVDLSNPAFDGGYGAILVQVAPLGNQGLFQAHLATDTALYSVSGNPFTGGVYRVPYIAGTKNMVITVTNLLASDTLMHFVNIAPSLNTLDIVVHGLSTFRFDAASLGWTLNGNAAVEVTAPGGAFSMTGYLQTTGKHKLRVYPIRVAPL